MDTIKRLLDDESLYNAMNEAATFDEKQLIALLLIRNNVKIIRGWVVFFGVVSLIGLVLGLLF